MLYNVVLGDTRHVSDKWKLIKEGGFYFYEKADLGQRIRLSQDFENPDELVYEWGTDSIQCYNIGNDKIWRNNTSNMNPIFRKLDPTKARDVSERIVVYVTVMKNYKIVDFKTNYQILYTYHKKGYYQGCVVVLTREQLEIRGTKDLLTLFVYDRKKDAARQISIGFKDTKDTHLQTKSVNVKDPDEKQRIIERIQESRARDQESLLGFKCVCEKNTFLTSVYFTTPEYYGYLKKRVRICNKDVVCVNEETLKDRDRLLALVRKHTHGKQVRAITQMGLKLPLQVIKGANILYVFNLYQDRDGTVHLSCIKSN